MVTIETGNPDQPETRRRKVLGKDSGYIDLGNRFGSKGFTNIIMDLGYHQDNVLGLDRFVENLLQPYFQHSFIAGAPDQRRHIDLQNPHERQLAKTQILQDLVCEVIKDAFPSAADLTHQKQTIMILFDQGFFDILYFFLMKHHPAPKKRIVNGNVARILIEGKRITSHQLLNGTGHEINTHIFAFPSFPFPFAVDFQIVHPEHRLDHIVSDDFQGIELLAEKRFLFEQTQQQRVNIYLFETVLGRNLLGPPQYRFDRPGVIFIQNRSFFPGPSHWLGLHILQKIALKIGLFYVKPVEDEKQTGTLQKLGKEHQFERKIALGQRSFKHLRRLEIEKIQKILPIAHVLMKVGSDFL